MQKFRLYGFDNLRAFVIFIVVLMHTLSCYMAFAPAWWYVQDPQSSFVFTIPVIVLDVPGMPILFFLAGYFALGSLARHGAAAFLADKTRRIGLPWVVGAMLLAPVIGYFTYLSRGRPETFLEFWRTVFFGPSYGHAVYWFLGILSAEFAVLAALSAVSPRLRTTLPTPVRPRRRWLLLFVAGLALPSWGFACLYPLDQWSHCYLFLYQPVRLPLYAGYFALGVVAARHGWFTLGGYTPRRGRALAAAAVTGLAYLGSRIAVPPGSAAAVVVALQVTALNLFAFAGTMAALAVFARTDGTPVWFWRPQARASYAVYYLHSLVLYPFVMLLRPLPASIFLKAPLALAFAYLVSLALGLALTRLPVLRRVF